MMHRSERWKRRAAVVSAVLLGAGALVWWFRYDTYHLVVVHDGVLYRDGNRGMREFAAAVRRAKPRTVVCIVDDREIQAEEFVAAQAYLAKRGIAFIRIPIVKGDVPTNEQIREFLTIATDPARQPVLYHDNEGIRRAGMMQAAYQESVLGYDDARARASMRMFGHGEVVRREVEAFIEAYDGPRRELTRPLPRGRPRNAAPAAD
jgi:hypothetical protein